VTDIPWQPLPPDPLGPWDDLPAHSPARPPADFRPAPPAESFHQPLPPKAPAEVGYLRFHMQRLYSHSMVPGGLDVMSRTTRLTSRTSLVMRVEILASTS
jgi:hypothetical protein